MDGYGFHTEHDTSRIAAAGKPRSFLFLQGPISDFFDRLGRALIGRGHRVHRVNLHFGDQLFWHLPATHYRGHFDGWRAFIGEFLDRHAVTDLVLHGDRRPYHMVAAEEARARGIAVMATDLGYVRPDWITLEWDGMSTYSRFPREPAAIRALAEQFPAPDLQPLYHTPFRLVAALDIAYNLALVFGRALYPHYRYHGIFHPFTEYAGWVGSRTMRLLTGRANATEKSWLQAAAGSYFLFPLQLATDFQVRAHSPFADARDAVREVVASFARSGSAHKLVIVVHPLDNGLIRWCPLVAALAREYGVSEQVIALEGGIPGEVLRKAAGIVTINSTVGTTALYNCVPVKVLGNAVFDIPGITSQQPLDAFWLDPSPPDLELTAAFFLALVGTTQVKGGYYTRASQDQAIAGFVERLEGRLYPLPRLRDADLDARPVRAGTQNVIIIGASSQIGRALARAYAAPGVRLCLVGEAADGLAGAADDCRRRGAIVDAIDTEADSQAGDGPVLAGPAQASDRDAPAYVVVVDAGSGMAAMMTTLDALAEQLQQRGRGHIVLVGAVGGRTLRGIGREDLLSYGVSLRHRLRAHGVAVSVVAPGLVAARLAARFGQPAIAEIAPDRAARLICRGIRKRRETIALTGPPTAAIRALRLSLSRLREWARNAMFPPVDPVVDAAEDEPLPGKSGMGD